MTILHVSPSYNPAFVYGGPTRSVAGLCEQLAKIGVHLTVITTTANGRLELPRQKNLVKGVEVTYHSRWTGDHSHFSPGLLWAFCWKIKKVQIIHIHSWWNLVVIPVVLICRLRGIKPVLSPRGMLSPYTLKSPAKSLFQRLIGQWLLKGTILHATSIQEASDALMSVSDWPHFVLPNIIELPPLGYFFPNTPPVNYCQFIFLSRIHPVKGLEMLFAVLSVLDFPWRLQIVGEGDVSYIAQLQQLAQNHGIAEQIEWLGWQKGTEKFQLLADADLFLLPSQSENFANAVLESLAVGTPVVVSNKVGLSDYIAKQKLGWVASLGKGTWANTLRTAWEAQNTRKEIRLTAPTLVQRDFGAETLAHKYMEAYQRIYPL